jgi:hypothetical protein
LTMAWRGMSLSAPRTASPHCHSEATCGATCGMA